MHFKSISPDTIPARVRRGRHSYAAELIKSFMDADIEAAEVLGWQDKYSTKEIVTKMLQSVCNRPEYKGKCRCMRSGDRVFLVRLSA